MDKRYQLAKTFHRLIYDEQPYTFLFRSKVLTGSATKMPRKSVLLAHMPINLVSESAIRSVHVNLCDKTSPFDYTNLLRH